MTDIINNRLRQRLDKKEYPTTDRLIDNSSYIGVELEQENIRFFSNHPTYPQVLDLWTAVEDHSLRNGTEFVFSEPYRGKCITNALDLMAEFIGVFESRHGQLLLSDRTSVHIHLDVRELDEGQLWNLILTYMLFERIIFAAVSPLRFKNNYCKPLTDSDFKTLLIPLYRRRDLERLFSVINDRAEKYSALNILPITRYGSVEFRHMHGTKDMAEVEKWINIVLMLKKIAIERTITDTLSVVKDEGITSVTRLFNGLIEIDSETRLHLLKGQNDILEILNYNSLTLIENKPSRRVSSQNYLAKYLEKRNQSTLESGV